MRWLLRRWLKGTEPNESMAIILHLWMRPVADMQTAVQIRNPKQMGGRASQTTFSKYLLNKMEY